MKKKENRLNTIIGMLREQPTLTIRELASVLECTTERHFTSQI